jgi:hypothetical protein
MRSMTKHRTAAQVVAGYVKKPVKVTRGPSHPFDERYQVDPASKPYGAGFAAVGVGRDVNTGKPWGRS